MEDLKFIACQLMYVLCCVCFHPIHSGHQVRLTYQPRVTQDEGHTGFLIHLSAVRALIFLARRIQSFLSLVDCEVGIGVLKIQSFSTTRWAFLFFYVYIYMKTGV